MNINQFFSETNNTSIRKVITFLTILVFAGAQITWIIANYGKELPTSYWSADLAIIFFYFSKNFFRNVKLSSNDSNK